MTNIETMEWIRFVQHLGERLDPADVQKIVKLAAERDDLERRLAQAYHVPVGTVITGDPERAEWKG